MEWELRIILGIIGVIIIGYVAYDAWKRSRKAKQRGFDLTDLGHEDFRDGEGFDRDGIGQVRVIKLEPDQVKDSESSVKPRGIQEPEDSGQAQPLDEEPIIATRDERLLVEDELGPKDHGIVEDDDTEDYFSEPELIFSLTLENKEQPFNGGELLQLLIEKGCRFGEMDIFHRYKSAQNTKQKYFSIANAFKPGVFDLDTMSSQEFAGISFFMGIPGAYEPEVAYQTMVQTARELKNALGGKLMDSSRSVFTDQTFQHELEQIKEYKRKKLMKAHS
jgi:cell division protein ZipA